MPWGEAQLSPSTFAVTLIAIGVATTIPAAATFSGRYQGHDGPVNFPWAHACPNGIGMRIKDARLSIGSGVKASVEAVYGPPRAFGTRCNPPKPHCYRLDVASFNAGHIRMRFTDRADATNHAVFLGDVDGLHVRGQYRFFRARQGDRHAVPIQVKQTLDQLNAFYRPDCTEPQ